MEILYAESSSLPASKSTPLSPGVTTYYFRNSFNVDKPLANIAELEIGRVVDAGAVSYGNYADRTVNNSVYEYFSLEPTNHCYIPLKTVHS